jgi:hypothetical protein
MNFHRFQFRYYLRTAISIIVFLTLIITHPSISAQAGLFGDVTGVFVVSNGQAADSIPIAVASGRGGMQPELPLNYSGAGSGVLGAGLSVVCWPLPAARRRFHNIAIGGRLGLMGMIYSVSMASGQFR